MLLGPDGEETGSFCTLDRPRPRPRPDRGPPHHPGDAGRGAQLRRRPPVPGRHAVGPGPGRAQRRPLRSRLPPGGVRPGRRRVGWSPPALATVDTLGVAQSHLQLQGKARLVDCCTHFGLCWDDHHSALGDARVTAALFRSMRAELGDDVLDLTSRLDAAAATSWPGASPEPPSVSVRRPAAPSRARTPGRALWQRLRRAVRRRRPRGRPSAGPASPGRVRSMDRDRPT